MKIIDIPQSGHLGTFISFRNRFGQVRRPYVIPANPRTLAQVRVRRQFGDASAHWRTLSEEQRAGWRAFAEQVQSHGVLGGRRPLTGHHLFVKINKNLAMIGLPQVVEPPGFPCFGFNPVGNLTITNSGGIIMLKLAVPAAPTTYTLLWGTAPGSAGASFPGRFVYLGLLPAPVAAVSDVTTPYVTRYGAPPAGSRVFVYTCQQLNGWQDLPKPTTAIVPPA